VSEQSDHEMSAQPRERVEAEHRRLAELAAEVRGVLDGPPTLEQAKAVFAELREAAEAHFVREESLYFPTVWALRPALEQQLRSILDAHSDFRARLVDVADAIDRAEFSEAARRLGELEAVFQAHEKLEEEVLGPLDLEPDA